MSITGPLLPQETVVVPLKTKEHQQLQLSTYDRPQYGVPKKERKKGVRKSWSTHLGRERGDVGDKKVEPRNIRMLLQHSNVALSAFLKLIKG
jgi:hypothetical protein